MARLWRLYLGATALVLLAFLGWKSYTSTALLGTLRPKEEPALRRRYLANEAGALQNEIRLAVSPLDPETVLEAWFRLLAEGTFDEASALLRREAREGTPLPIEG